MEKSKKEEFRQTLVRLRDQTAGDYERMVESSGEEFAGGELPDPNDEASRTISRRIMLSISDQSHATLTKIQDALERIETDEYGECVECGGNIPVGRLELIPWAEYCVRCQEKIEQEEKESG